MKLAWFAGVDWGSQKHQACVLDAAGEVLGEREFEHGGAGLSQMADWLLSFAAGDAGDAGDVGVAIETPSGPVVESLLEHGFAVHSINPKQLGSLPRSLLASGRERRPAGCTGACLGTAYRRALSAATRADRPGDRRATRVVAPERSTDAGTRTPGESDAAAALALLPAVPRRG